MTARQVAALAALAGVFVALYLTLFKIGVIGELSCSVGSCETVNVSRWATLLGFPVAAWGLATYVVLLALALAGSTTALAHSRTITVALAALSGWGVLFSAWLTYLELFVIRAICIWCVTSAVLVTIVFVASLADLHRLRRSPERQMRRGAARA